MLKKMMLIGLLIIVFSMSLLANSDYKNKKSIKGKLVDKIFKRFAKYYGSDAQGGKERVGFMVYKADEPKYKDYKTYIAFFGPRSTPPRTRRNVIALVKDGKVFIMGNDFNYLLKNEHVLIDSTNQVEIAKLFLRLTRIYHYEIINEEKVSKNYIEDIYKDIPDNILKKYKDYFIKNKPTYNFTIEITIKRSNGRESLYSFDFKNSYISCIRMQIIRLKNNKKDFLLQQPNYFAPPHSYYFRDKRIKIFNSDDEKITFCLYNEPDTIYYNELNVKLKQNGDYNTINATVRLELTCFSAKENIIVDKFPLTKVSMLQVKEKQEEQYRL